MREHGLNYSKPASTPHEAVLFTDEPYAAVAFREHATPEAKARLQGIIAAIDESWRSESKAHIRCPADMELWPFQKAGVEYIMRRGGGLIGDQPGLGKTAQAICIANEMRAKRVLVICPASIRLQWVKAIQAWTTMPWPFTIHPIMSARNGTHPTAQWTVTSYDLAATEAIGCGLTSQTYDLMIIDEAHYLKEPTTRRTRAIWGGGKDRAFHPIASRCGAIVALTGTPLPNRPREAFTLAKGLCHEAIDWMSEHAFERKYNPRKVLRSRTGIPFAVDERTGHSHELQARLRTHFMVRREKLTVMPQLGYPAYDIIEVDKTGPVKRALEAEAMLQIDPESFQGADGKIDGHVSVVRHMMGVAIAPQVAEYVADLMDGGDEKITLFAHHIDVLDILEAKLAKYGTVRIDGSTGAKTKQERIDAFRTNPDAQIMLGNMLAMGTGTDGLQDVSSLVILAEPDWVPGNNQQAVDRLHRGGQTRKVRVNIIVAPGSIAERVLASALRKLRTIHNSLDARL
jgi:SWI/SNF-related matrix-associated actin-dependent regulator 1 of chromatin subfamily A